MNFNPKKNLKQSHLVRVSRFFIYIFAIIFLASYATDASAQKRKNRRYASATEKSKSEPVARSGTSSSSNRHRLSASVLGEIGLIDYVGFGAGARASLIFSRDVTLEVGYLQANFALFGNSKETTLISSRAKWFLGNSFYLAGGAGYRENIVGSTETNYSLKDSVTTKIEKTYTHDSITAEFGLGNQWQFSGFTIGCDWIGISQPITTLSEGGEVFSNQPSASLTQDSSDNNTSGSGTDANADGDAEDFSSMKTNASSSSVQLVRLYIGWSF